LVKVAGNTVTCFADLVVYTYRILTAMKFLLYSTTRLPKVWKLSS